MAGLVDQLSKIGIEDNATMEYHPYRDETEMRKCSAFYGINSLKVYKPPKQ